MSSFWSTGVKPVIVSLLKRLSKNSKELSISTSHGWTATLTLPWPANAAIAYINLAKSFKKNKSLLSGLASEIIYEKYLPLSVFMWKRDSMYCGPSDLNNKRFSLVASQHDGHIPGCGPASPARRLYAETVSELNRREFTIYSASYLW